MPPRNHVKKAVGRAYNYLPKRLKPTAKKIIQQGPSRAEKGKKVVDNKINRLLYGKKRGR